MVIFFFLTGLLKEIKSFVEVLLKVTVVLAMSFSCRWVKFEEDVEEGGERWSKPHVATLSLHSLFELRSFLLNGTVILDMDASTLEQITDLLLDNMINQGQLTFESREKVREISVVWFSCIGNISCLDDVEAN